MCHAGAAKECSRELTLVQTDEVNRKKIQFNSTLTSDQYRTVLDLNDYSNAIANAQVYATYPLYHKMMIERAQQISLSISKRGWSQPEVLEGATGANNQDPDASGAIIWNRKKHIILAAFHGSRSGSLI